MTQTTMQAIESIRAQYAGQVIGYHTIHDIVRAAHTTMQTMQRYGVIVLDHTTTTVEECPADELEYDCPACGEDNYDADRDIYYIYHTAEYYRVTEA